MWRATGRRLVGGALLALLWGCRDGAPPRGSTMVESADAPPSCATLEGRFAALDLVPRDGTAISSELGPRWLPKVTRAALACPGEAGAIEVVTSSRGDRLRLVRYGWQADTLFEPPAPTAHVAFSPVGAAAPDAAWPTVGLDAPAVDALIEAWEYEHLHIGIDVEEADDLDTFIAGPFTAPGARDEAVLAVWGGLSHPTMWQVWLLERDAEGAWRVQRPVALGCSGSLDALDVEGDGRLELLVDSSCMHQGYDDGTIRIVSLAAEHAWSEACAPGGGLADVVDHHDRVVFELPYGYAAGAVYDLVVMPGAAGQPLELAVRAEPYVGPDETASPDAQTTLTRYVLRDGRYEAVAPR